MRMIRHFVSALSFFVICSSFCFVYAEEAHHPEEGYHEFLEVTEYAYEDQYKLEVMFLQIRKNFGSNSNIDYPEVYGIVKYTNLTSTRILKSISWQSSTFVLKDSNGNIVLDDIYGDCIDEYVNPGDSGLMFVFSEGNPRISITGDYVLEVKDSVFAFENFEENPFAYYAETSNLNISNIPPEYSLCEADEDAADWHAWVSDGKGGFIESYGKGWTQQDDLQDLIYSFNVKTEYDTKGYGSYWLIFYTKDSIPFYTLSDISFETFYYGVNSEVNKISGRFTKANEIIPWNLYDHVELKVSFSYVKNYDGHEIVQETEIETETRTPLENYGHINMWYRDLERDSFVEYRFPQGIYVISVDPGGAAEKAGLQAEDVVTAIAGKYITSTEEFTKELSYHAPGEAVEVRYRRMTNASVDIYEFGDEQITTAVLTEGLEE